MQRSSTAWELVKEWQANGRKQAPPCPICGSLTLRIEDQSVRPYSEWYHVTCTTCDFDETVHLPMRQPMSSLD